jgi:hypothetical protein
MLGVGAPKSPGGVSGTARSVKADTARSTESLICLPNSPAITIAESATVERIITYSVSVAPRIDLSFMRVFTATFWPAVGLVV